MNALWKKATSDVEAAEVDENIAHRILDEARRFLSEAEQFLDRTEK